LSTPGVGQDKFAELYIGRRRFAIDCARNLQASLILLDATHRETEREKWNKNVETRTKKKKGVRKRGNVCIAKNCILFERKIEKISNPAYTV
jgi:hypothetical protein